MSENKTSEEKQKNKEYKKMDQSIGSYKLKDEKNKKVYKKKQTRAIVKKSSAELKKTEKAKPPALKNKPKNLNKNNKSSKAKKPSVKVVFLGGLNEIGKNITMFECGNDAFLLDCGMAFPDDEMMGIDLVIPDFSYIEKNKEKIKAIILTHGHEDHIGSIPYLLRKCALPICATPLTLGLVKHKLKEHNLLRATKLYEVLPKQKVKIGCMEIEFIHVNHSIPDAVGVAIHTPAGTLVHTGDFKIDFTPANTTPTDLNTFARLGDKGVLALFADSTNAELPGSTPTEQKVKATLMEIFNKNQGKRIVIASFASNIDRIQQIIECAIKFERKVAVSGRSMTNYINTAKELGYIKVPKDTIIDLNEIHKYPKEDTVLITTGSQGEPMSALYRMANSDHKTISLSQDDVVIISARPIPGNEKAIGCVIDELMKKGCKVIYESMYDIHVSGHARQDELKIIHSLVKPKYFIPVHGEQKHLRKHALLAQSLGMDKKNIFVGDIGCALEINENHLKELEKVDAGQVFVDGLGVGDVGNIVLKDRKLLGEGGIIIAVIVMNKQTGKVTSGPDIISRGFVYVKENEELMRTARKAVNKTLEDCEKANIKDWTEIKAEIKSALYKLFFAKTKRTPMILPVIMMDKKANLENVDEK